jgi:hypothetical protein
MKHSINNLLQREAYTLQQLNALTDSLEYAQRLVTAVTEPFPCFGDGIPPITQKYRRQE